MLFQWKEEDESNSLSSIRSKISVFSSDNSSPNQMNQLANDELHERACQVRAIEESIESETSKNELISKINFLKETPALISNSLFQTLLQILPRIDDSIELQKAILSALELSTEGRPDNCLSFFQEQYYPFIMSLIKYSDDDTISVPNYEVSKYGLGILANIVKTSDEFSSNLFNLGIFNDLMQLLSILTVESNSPNRLEEHRTLLEHIMKVITNFFKYPILQNVDAFAFMNDVYHQLPNFIFAGTGELNLSGCLSSEKSSCLTFVRKLFININQYDNDELKLHFIERFNDEQILHWVLEQLRSNNVEEDGIDSCVIKCALEVLIAVSGFYVPESLRQQYPGPFEFTLINDPIFLDSLQTPKLNDECFSTLIAIIYRNLAASDDLNVIQFIFRKYQMIKFVVNQIDKSYAIKWESVFFFINLLLFLVNEESVEFIDELKSWLDYNPIILEAITEMLFNPYEDKKRDALLNGILLILRIGEQTNGYDTPNKYAQIFYQNDLLDQLNDLEEVDDNLLQKIKDIMEDALQFDQNEE